MAGGIPCMFCDGQRSAEVLLTWLSTGASLNTCVECFSPAMIHVLANDLGIDPDRFYEYVKRHVDREAKRQAAEAAKGTADDGGANGASDGGESTHVHAYLLDGSESPEQLAALAEQVTRDLL